MSSRITTTSAGSSTVKTITTAVLLVCLAASLPGCMWRAQLDAASFPSRPQRHDAGTREPIHVSTTGGERVDVLGDDIGVRPGDHSQRRFALSSIEELYVGADRHGHALGAHGRTFDFRLGDGTTFDIARTDWGLTAALLITLGIVVAGIIGAAIGLSQLSVGAGPGGVFFGP